MRCNVTKTGQAFRLLLGGLLTAWAVAGGPSWTWVGLIVIATGTWRFCPIFMLLRIRTGDQDS
ncbi:MAG: DUF2892 domain-containing protein [Bdellovibrionales bacterium]|nr:DUF2892 domain-containing protein [Bdellovibrionales bacterium]